MAVELVERLDDDVALDVGKRTGFIAQEAEGATAVAVEPPTDGDGTRGDLEDAVFVMGFGGPEPVADEIGADDIAGDLEREKGITILAKNTAGQ